MFGRRKNHVLITILCLKIVTAHSGESSDGVCSDHVLVQRFIAKMTSRCYDVSMPTPYSHWRMCNDEEAITCDRIKNYVAVIPSCSACNRLTGNERVVCFQRQLQAVQCTIDEWVLPTLIKTFSCNKVQGKCELQRTSIFNPHSTVKTTTIRSTSSFPTKPTITTTTGEDDPKSTAGILGATGFHRNCKKCKICEECQPCEQMGCSGMSVGGAVGLFFLGVFLGALVTCALCLFVPAFHSKSSSILHNKIMKKSGGPTNDNEANPSSRQQAIGISNAQYSGDRVLPAARGDRVLPSAPEDTYHDLSRQSTGDSHTYVGLQSPTSESAVYSDPAASDTYDAPHDRVSHQSSVSSPTYHVPQDGIISGTTNRNTEQPKWRSNQASNRSEDDTYDHTNRPIRNNDTHPTGNTYNSFQNPNNQNLSEKTRNKNSDGNPAVSGTTDHQYFVLEPHNNNDTVLPQTHHQSPNRDSTYSPSHSYFVLEKQS